MLVATMGISPLENSLFECLNSLHDHKESYDDHNQFTHSESIIFQDKGAAVLSNSLSDTPHVQDAHELASDGIPVVSHPKKTNLCEDLKINPVNLSTAITQKSFCKSATFPCSKAMPFTNGTNEMRNDGLHEQHHLKSENSACTRSISLPTPSKLVSAMKGGRENQGIPPKKLTLTWAPDVYDPPVTLLSHTVKGHSRQRSRSTKSTVKHKHKGKSSHGSSSSSDKKQYRKYVGKSESRSKSVATRDRLHLGDSKPQESRDRLLINDFNQSNIELLDYGVAGKDTNCGSSFLRESLAKVHLSVTEAT